MEEGQVNGNPLEQVIPPEIIPAVLIKEVRVSKLPMQAASVRILPTPHPVMIQDQAMTPVPLILPALLIPVAVAILEEVVPALTGEWNPLFRQDAAMALGFRI